VPNTRIPFTVIGGFLGAGKTTLLNHWLRNAGGQRLAVLVNDFGALNVDAMLVEANHGDTIALSNGCVCCQIGDDLSLALLRVLDSDRPFDAVIVEASGVADPWRIAQLGRADPRLVLDAVIVLVDASVALEQSRDALLADTLERQLRAADLVVLNKIDLAEPAALPALAAWMAGVAGAVPQVQTAHAELPLALLSGAHIPGSGQAHGSAPERCGHAEHSHEPDPAHGSQFESWSAQPGEVFEIDALRNWLRAPPCGLIRLKGVLRTTPRSSGSYAWTEVQFAGRHGHVRAAGAPSAGAVLVAIGLRGQLPVAALESFFDAAAESGRSHPAGYDTPRHKSDMETSQ
jgi:G3E family GTPase